MNGRNSMDGSFPIHVSPSKDEYSDEVLSPASIANVDLQITDKVTSCMTLKTIIVSSDVLQEENIPFALKTTKIEPGGKNSDRRRLKGILKNRSSFPKPLSTDDAPPIRMSETGLLKNFTEDKHGNIIPFQHCFFFANQTYEENANKAVIERLKIRENKKRAFEEMNEVAKEAVKQTSQLDIPL
jgi:hypothetical protein